MLARIKTLVAMAVLLSTLSYAQTGNKPDRLEWFRDQGLGLFIHWSVDSQLGFVISHSLAGASDAYSDRFFHELPKTFDPSHFNPDDIARLARFAGFRYMVFTTKHHSGFAMWDTGTTPFNILNTPYGKDITAQLFTAFRNEGVAPGVYLSPDDFLYLHTHHIPVQRMNPEVQPSANPGLLALDEAQLTELLTRYGPVATVFFDGEATQLRELAWKLQPSTVVTRGAIETPEQNIPGSPLPGAWEANMTMGTAWQYQPSDEVYKLPHDLLRILIHTRARGGNLLLNIGPRPDGTLAPEQEEHLRTLGSWMFINSDCIYATRPWVVTNEGNLWFTRSKDHTALYTIVDDTDDAPIWKRGDWREFVLKTARATSKTTISVLGQNDELVEYRPDLHPQSTFHQEPDGLHLRVMRAQRLRDSDAWPYPTVIKLTNVDEAFTPPTVHTQPATVAAGTIILHGSWLQTLPDTNIKVGFETRLITGEDTRSRLRTWQPLTIQPAATPGAFQATFQPAPNERYEFRTVLQHPLLTLYGEELPVPAK